MNGIKKILKRIKYRAKYGIIDIVKQPSLTEIGSRFKTDKCDDNHTFNNISYLDIYEKYFSQIRNNPIKLLEIGINAGASLRTWKEYFKYGEVFGIDIDPNCKNHKENRINIKIGNQDDVNFLSNCFREVDEFDIIIDDGSHINKHMITSFDYLFNNRLKSKGIYIIEDLSCSYKNLQTEYDILNIWPGMKYNDPDENYDNKREDMNNFFFEKIKKLDFCQGNILSIHFWSMICLITKT